MSHLRKTNGSGHTDVKVCVNVNIYIDTYIHICTYIHVGALVRAGTWALSPGRARPKGICAFMYVYENVYVCICICVCICIWNHILVKTKLGHFADNADFSNVKSEILKYASEYCTICNDFVRFFCFVRSVRLL